MLRSLKKQKVLQQRKKINTKLVELTLNIIWGAFSFGIGRHFVVPNLTNRITGGATAVTGALVTAGTNAAVYTANVGGSATISDTVEYFQNDAISIAFAVNENL